jgi:Pro-kumamolisin, activation domain/Bacterial Ig-like domain (group 3)
MQSSVRIFLGCFLGMVVAPGFLAAQAVIAAPRITQAIDESRLIVLQGNTHPLARREFEGGEAPSSLALNRMLLVLGRSPEQESALGQLLDNQQDKTSPNYHKWLTPQEFGQQFGPAEQDIQTLVSWLQSHGFQVAEPSPGRMVIEFSGSAGQVAETFHTAIHKYVVNGEEHWANASDPQIPVALAPVVGGVLSLHNFRARPLIHSLGAVSRSRATGAITPARPLETIPGSECGVQGSCYGVGPYDFATIYNVLPLWTATPAINGTGQTIAIVGETDINTQDVSNFRTFFGLPAPNLQVIHDGPAPGILRGDEETESDLDVEWSGAVAPGAMIDFVVAESTETTQGIDLSALHIIDNNLASVMSESYGACELQIGTSGNQFFNQLWQQAAAQGITVMLATGDSGSAGCENRALPTPAAAQFGLQVSGFASTPYNVAVGGTDFNDLRNTSYWDLTNAATTQASAKSYIPETTWNDTCTNPVFGTLLGFSTNAETNCNNSQLVNFVSTIGGSGGKSSCISSDGQTPSSCMGGYAKPSWQSALTPNDGARDLPDVSLFAASGSPSGSFYLICETDQPVGGVCSLTEPTGEFLGVGGTSASSPAFAGIMALVNQQTGSRQGNANYVLYKLATQQPSAFHDVMTGTIAMPCQTGSTNCTTSITGDTYGILSGYNAIAGYDLATGLGSVNAFNLVSKWNSVTLAPSITTLGGLTPTTVTHGQPVNVVVTVAPQSGTGTPAGTVALAGGPAGSVTDFDNHTLTNGSASWTTNLLPGGTYNVTAHYPGDGNYSSSDSATSIPVTVSKENGKVGVRLVTFDSKGNTISPSATTAAYGSPYILRVAVTGATCSSNSRGQVGCPTGNVTLTDNNTPLDAGTFPLNSLGYTEDQTIQLMGGSHAVLAQYAGDNSFNATSANATINIAPAGTTLAAPSLFPGSTAQVGGSFFVQTTLQTQSSGLAPSGAVTFFSNGSPLTGTVVVGSYGSPSAPASLLAYVPVSYSTPGTYAITATFAGDGNYSGASSSATNLILRYPPPTVSISATPSEVVSGNSVTLTAVADAEAKGPPLTGTFVFSNGPPSQIPGNVVLSQGTDSNGFATLGGTFTFVPLIPQAVYAEYSGDSNYSAAISAPTIVDVDFPDFQVSTTPPGATVNVSQGASAQVSLQITYQFGYTGTVTFGNGALFPPETTFSFSPSTVTGTATTQLTITTTAPQAAARKGSGIARGVGWTAGSGIMVCALLAGASSGRRRWSALLSLVALGLVLTLPSCGGGGEGAGGGGDSGGNLDPGTPKGTYVLTVAATSGSLTHTATFQLVVQ